MADTEATGTTGLAMVILATVFLGMVITTIAIISSLITAAGNGAPTARSTSATAIIDSRRRKEARPGRKARASFFATMMIDHLDRPPVPGNQSRCTLIGLPHRSIGACEAPGSIARLSLNVCSVSATSLNAFGKASRSMRVERNWQETARVPATASWMCDGSHICRRAGGLGFNSREVLWEDLVRQPLVTSKRSSTPAEKQS